MQNDHSVAVREMRPGEEKALLAAARLAFIHSPLEQLAISKPKSALVAEVDRVPAGAMFLHIYGSGQKKTGYLEIGFVVKAFRGQGIGRVLYSGAIQYLREQGCDCVAAVVLDDNAASWMPLKSSGLEPSTLAGLVRSLGFGRAAALWLRTLFCLACGAQFWIDRPAKSRGSLRELAAFLCVNLLLFLPRLAWVTRQPGQIALALSAYLFVLAAGILFGGAGCLVAGGRWRVSFPRGGALLTPLLNSVGAVFPMVGHWVPESPQATRESRRALGVQAAVEWVGMLALFALGALLLGGNRFFQLSATFAASLLVYRVLFFMPFGGGRVWRWSKPVFSVLACISLGLIAVIVSGVFSPGYS